jgi:fructose-1,6-bisphosphatase I
MPQVTVTEHLLLHQRMSSRATGQFTSLLSQLILSAKIISREVNKAGLVDVLGFTGDTNVQGERVKKLDEFANDVLIYRMQRAGVLCAIASEENADIIPIPEHLPQGHYVLIFDPLDGSSNIEANVNIGTIFSIYRRKSAEGSRNMLSDLLQPGDALVAAGYFLYGTSTMMVYSSGKGVYGFTLDPSVGEFLLSHDRMQIPGDGNIYSVNEAYWNHWDDATKEIVRHFKSTDTATGKPYSSRYIGSLVADFHRTLLYGGIFMYPPDMRDPSKPRGKLRLLCEAAPVSFLAEQAGGLGTDGRRRIGEIVPGELHERVPLFVGARQDVEKVSEIYAKHYG